MENKNNALPQLLWPSMPRNSGAEKLIREESRFVLTGSKFPSFYKFRSKLKVILISFLTSCVIFCQLVCDSLHGRNIT